MVGLLRLVARALHYRKQRNSEIVIEVNRAGIAMVVPPLLFYQRTVERTRPKQNDYVEMIRRHCRAPMSRPNWAPLRPIRRHRRRPIHQANGQACRAFCHGEDQVGVTEDELDIKDDDVFPCYNTLFYLCVYSSSSSLVLA